MKSKIALALAICAVAFCAVADNEQDTLETSWLYTEDGITPESIFVTVYKKDGGSVDNIEVNANTKIGDLRSTIMTKIGESGTAPQAYALAAQGLAAALIEKYRNDLQSAQIDVLASSLGALLLECYGKTEYLDENGNWVPASEDMRKASWPDVVTTVTNGRKMFRAGMESNPETKPFTKRITKGAPDERVLKRRESRFDEGEHWSFRGIDDLLQGAYWSLNSSEFWQLGKSQYSNDRYAIPIFDSTDGNGKLKFMVNPIVDDKVVDVAGSGQQAVNKARLTFRKWYLTDNDRYLGDSSGNTLVYVLTNEAQQTATLRSNTELLVKDKTTNTLRYVPFGDRLKADGADPDEKTIEYTDDPAEEDSARALRIAGSLDAAEGQYPIMGEDGWLTWEYEIIADESSLTTNPATRTISIKGWGDKAEEQKLSDIMLAKPSEPKPDQPAEERVVLVRHTEGSTTNLELYAFGNMYKMSWSTNWNDAVKDIVDVEQVKMGERMTNILYSTVGDPDTIYNRLMKLTERAEAVGDRVNDTYTHITNLTQSAAGDVDSFYSHITNLTQSARDSEEKAKSTYQHILTISESAENESDAIYDRITNVLYKAKTSQEQADNAYTHLTNLIKTAGNPEAVYHHITNLTYKTHYTFITNVVEYMQTFENWTYVTNYLVMYMGVEQKKGDGPVAPPPVDRKDDPYDSEYEHDRVKDSLLPVKTALIVNDATNKPMDKLSAVHMLDFDVLDTNLVAVGSGADAEVYSLVQLRGYRAADVEDSPKIPIKRKRVDVKMPTGEAPYYEPTSSHTSLDWTDYPVELFGVTTNELRKVQKFLRENNITNILHTVISNNEWLATIRTNFYERVVPEKFLDKHSIWTNWTDQARTEIRDFHRAAVGDYPVKEWNEKELANTVVWKPKPKADSDVMFDITSWDERHRSLEVVDDYGLLHATNVWQVYGFGNAEVGTSPVKREDGFGNVELQWEMLGGNAIKFIGTDNSHYTIGKESDVTNEVTFASAADSNVQVGVQGDGSGNVTITIGVYYLNNASVQPPYAE